MDLDRIERTLNDYRTAVLEASSLRMSTNRAVQDAVKLQTPLVRKVLESLEPGLGRFKIGGGTSWNAARDAALHGIGLVEILRQGDEWFSPNAPALQASSMHRLVWTPATTYWQMQDWQRAVEAAYRAVHASVQQKMGRSDLDNSKLFDLAFGLKAPTEGKRIWRRGNTQTETWRSKQLGLSGLGQALAMGVRNILTHDNVDLDPTDAMELLGVLSVFARWIDDCDVVIFPVRDES